MTTLNAPPAASSPQMYTAADGQIYTVYEVPTATACRILRWRNRANQEHFIDPATGQEIEWQGNWRSLSSGLVADFSSDTSPRY